MGKSLGMFFPAVIRVFLLVALSTATASTQTTQIWQGGFKTEQFWGGMELVFTDVSGKTEVQARFTPRGHLVTPALQETRIQRNAIGFVVNLNGIDYRFTGQQKGAKWMGTFRSEKEPRTGSWALTRVPLLAEVTAGELLPPTGSLRVGRAQFHWTDESRPELESRIPDDSRELIVYVFYPASRTVAGGVATYIPDVDVMRGADWTDAQISHLKSVRTHTWQDAPVETSRRPFPVVIFMPGGGQKTLLYTALFEELVSHGYVVAAVQPPFSAGFVRLPNGKISGSLPFAERGWETPKSRDDMPRIYEQMVVHWARDMSFVLDQLTVLNERDERFAGTIDVGRVGALGHSRGGQAAGKVRLLDSRFSAGVNLDGNIRGVGFPPDALAGGGTQPFLWIEKQLPWPTKDSKEQTIQQFESMWANGDRLMASIAGQSFRVAIGKPEIGHLDFGDTAMLNPTLNVISRTAKLRTAAITRAVILSFFDRHVKRLANRRVEELAQQYPEIRVTRYK